MIWISSFVGFLSKDLTVIPSILMLPRASLSRPLGTVITICPLSFALILEEKPVVPDKPLPTVTLPAPVNL